MKLKAKEVFYDREADKLREVDEEFDAASERAKVLQDRGLAEAVKEKAPAKKPKE